MKVDMMEFLIDILPAIVSAFIAGFGVYVAVERKLATLETKLDLLSERVEKHNNVIERTYRLEEQVKTLYKNQERIEAKC